MAPGLQNFLETSTLFSLNKETIFQVFLALCHFIYSPFGQLAKISSKRRRGGGKLGEGGAKIGDPNDEVIISTR